MRKLVCDISMIFRIIFPSYSYILYVPMTCLWQIPDHCHAAVQVIAPMTPALGGDMNGRLLMVI